MKTALAVVLSVHALLAAESVEDLLNQALLLAREQKWREAEVVLLRGQSLAPSDVRFPSELAGVAYRLGERGVAKQRLHAALRIEPGNVYANDFLGTLYLLDSNLPAAVKYWNRIGKPVLGAVRVDPPLPLETLLRDRAVTLSPGQLLTRESLRRTARNLDRLGVLAGYRFDLQPAPNDRFSLRLTPQPIGQFASGWLARLLPFARSLPYQAVHFDRYNIGQRAINFESLWRWDPDKRRIALSVSLPFRMNPRWQVRAFADGRDEDWGLPGIDSLLLRKYEAGAGLAGAVSSRGEASLDVSVARRTYRRNPSDPIFADAWSFQFPARLHYLLWESPERRWTVSGEARLAPGRVIGPDPSRFVMSDGGLAAEWLPEGWRLNAGARAGVTAGRIPFDQYFILGMERDNDLWLRGHVGTRDGRKGSAPMGSRYALIRSDVSRELFRLPLLRVEAGPFFDTGAVAGRFGSRGWLYDAGGLVTVRTAGSIEWTLVYGRDLRDGRGVFYTAVSRRRIR